MALNFSTTLYLVDPNTLQFEERSLRSETDPVESTLSRLSECKQRLGREIRIPLNRLSELHRFTELFAEHLRCSPSQRSGFFSFFSFRINRAEHARTLANDFAFLLQKKEQEALEQIQNHMDGHPLNYEQMCDLIRNQTPSIASSPQFQSLLNCFRAETALLLDIDIFKSALQLDPSLLWLKIYLETHPAQSMLIAIETAIESMTSDAKDTLQRLQSALSLIKDKFGSSYDLLTVFKGAWHLFNLLSTYSPKDTITLLEQTLSLTTLQAIEIVVHYLILNEPALPDTCLSNLLTYTDHDWIRILLDKNPPQAILEHFFRAACQSQPTTLFHEVFLRASQIHTSSISTVPSICLNLAYMIETQFVRTFSFTSLYYSRPDPRIPESVIVLTDGQIALISESSRPLSDGSAKLVHEAHLLPYRWHQKAKTIAISHNKTRFEAIKKEAYLYRLFSQNLGIWPLFDVCESGEKVYLLMERAEGDFKRFLETDSVLCPIALVSLLKQILSGLNAIHNKSYLHNDIKLKNLLYRIGDDGDIVAGIIDFAECCPSSNFQTPVPGYYGSILPTAPELWGQGAFSGDPYKVEMWALGYTLFQFVFNQGTSWDQLLHTAYIEDSLINESQRNEFRTLVRATIETPLAKLMAQQSHTTEERIIMLVYKLMRLDPQLRLSCTEALAEISQISQNA